MFAPMPTIIGISGSLRRGSYNTLLLRAVATQAPAGTSVEIASIHDLPLYDGDLEAEHGVPAAVGTLKDRIANSDGLLLATPEYNNSVPGVLKNAIDWLTRPPTDIARVFFNRPVALMGATMGAGGTNLAQAAWLPVLRVLGTRPWFAGRLFVSAAHEVFAADGSITDPRVTKQVQRFIDGFAAVLNKS